ncbi:MAG: hypothetical protein ACHQF0_16210 [Chitinophagales bacterium]
MKPAILCGCFTITVLFALSQNGSHSQEENVTLQNISNDTVLINLANTYFKQIRSISDKDHGKFWGLPIYGPIMIVDPDKRIIYANEQDNLNSLVRIKDIYIGILPDTEAVANTSISWRGKRWTMLIWGSLSKNDLKRNRLVFHELFHSIQDELGLPLKGGFSDHLDQKEGRIYFRLELEALKSALANHGHKRKKDLQNAFNFRMFRYQLFPNAKEMESALEWSEGLAEFSGVSLSKINEGTKNLYLGNLIDSATIFYPSFMRSFAYITGPVYGQLLSEKNPGWQRRITSQDDFSKLILKKYRLKQVHDLSGAVALEFNNYNGTVIKQEEEKKEQVRIEQVDKIRKKYTDAPVLIIPFSNKATGSFGPNNIIKISGSETFYESLELIDSFGRLTINKGGLKDYSKKQVRVSLPDLAVPNQPIIKTDEWELQLNKGWKLVPGPNKNLIVMQQ